MSFGAMFFGSADI